MTEKTFTIVGVSSMRGVPKFRVANGEIADRAKILERAGCTDVHFIKLETAMNKADAIAAYKALHPEAANIHMPNSKEDKAPTVRTVSIRQGRKKADAANELLAAVEEAGA
jgi:hypothetical protein